MNHIVVTGFRQEIVYSPLWEVDDKPTGPEMQITLTSLELRCLKYKAEGKTNYEIAKAENLSEHTVLLILDNARRRLRAGNIEETIMRVFGNPFGEA